MKAGIASLSAAVLTLACTATVLRAAEGPFDGRGFKGRIAYSSDGNFNDEDDWAASPVALAIFAEYGVKARLVHFDYNSILTATDPAWEQQHETSVLGAVEQYGYNPSLFYNCRKNLDQAVESIRNAVNASSAASPLYFIIAGPMEVPYLGILKSDPEKRKHVYAISHSRWNDGYEKRFSFRHNKRDVIALGVHWVQIADQNRYLSTSPFGRPAREQEWLAWHWMRDARDPKVRFLWDRMKSTGRADCSDAGMAWFLLTGEETARPAHLKRLLETRVPLGPLGERDSIRIEAENFTVLDQYEVEFRDDRGASHRVNVALTGAAGQIRTTFEQPYSAPSGRYDVEVRYQAEDGAPFELTLLVNGTARGTPWNTAGEEPGWRSRTIPGIRIQAGDEIAVRAQAGSGARARLDSVQLDRLGAPPPASGSRFTAGGPLEDPAALPGQVILSADKPGFLKYNGGGPAFLSGPENPEEFLYRGVLNPDGTRSGGGQEEIIDRLAQAGVNAFHAIMFRMRRCNIKDEGDDTHSPFLGHDPSRPLNQAVLDQWEGWLTRFEQKGIVVDLEFYNDATDVERMGWILDASGELHADERRWIAGVVRRFQHHKNIIWSIAESCNKLPASRTAHFKKIAELIAHTDRRHHPILQSFVVPDDPEGDFPKGGVLPDAYAGDPHIRMVTWLHVPAQGGDLEKMRRLYLGYYSRDAANFVVFKNETFHHPTSGAISRKYMWSAAMAGLQDLEAYHHADRTPLSTLRDDGRILAFLERTDFHRMKPRDDLAAGSTNWVLANPGASYIAYTHRYTGPMGVEGISSGVYDLKWFDPTDGQFAEQSGVTVSAGSATWEKPESFGLEVALYIRKR